MQYEPICDRVYDTLLLYFTEIDERKYLATQKSKQKNLIFLDFIHLFIYCSWSCLLAI